MLFNLTFKSAPELPKFLSKALLVKFVIDDKGLGESVKIFEEQLKSTFNPLQKNEFVKGEESEIRFANTESRPDLVILKKIKIDKKFSVDFFRDYLASVVKGIKSAGFQYFHIALPDYEKFKEYFESQEYFVQTFIEGVHLGNYNFDKYKSDKKDAAALTVKLHLVSRAMVRRVIEKTDLLMQSVFFSRDLVNEPANELTPLELAERTKNELGSAGVKVVVWKKKDLEKNKMHSILAVGRASSEEPCLIKLHYKPKGKPKKKIALVGKGVTYDSGGLSIKPTDSMFDMKIDMTGAATVIGIIKAAAEAKLPVEILGLVPAVENSIAGNAYKPGDIISTYSGKTIEVLNTDAEGRIIMADALKLASENEPDEIFDFATLTGACVVALGMYTAGVFTKSENISGKLYSSGLKTFERVWAMPMWDEYNKELKCDIADVKNLGSRWGGAITAAKFLENFVDEKITWTHLDIAGPSCKNDLTSYTKDFHTSFGIRLMYDYLLKI
jgi:leucyl aminopeptidase